VGVVGAGLGCPGVVCAVVLLMIDALETPLTLLMVKTAFAF